MQFQLLHNPPERSCEMRLPPESMNPNMSDKVLAMVERFASSRTCKCYERERSQILLYASQGLQNQQIAIEAGIHPNTVGKWRRQLVECVPLLNFLSEHCPKQLKKVYLEALKDDYRSGAPLKYSAEAHSVIKMMACSNPRDYGYTISHWSLPYLHDSVKKNVKVSGIESISIGAIYNILLHDNIKPWKIQYWLHSREKYEDYESYSEKVKAINAIYQLADKVRRHTEDIDICIYSFDEMTGTQALMHEHQRNVAPGHAEHVDPNYKRKGVTALIAFFDVISGRVINGSLGQTRTEEDVVAALRKVLDMNPKFKHVFVCDNLNTHLSEGVVRIVAERIGFQENLGVKGVSGILKNKESRMKFLGDSEHDIYFLFTPLHSSWLNQVEIWFGIIGRQLLRRGNFESVQFLEKSIIDFIEQWNEGFAHPFKWTYNSVPKKCESNQESEPIEAIGI